MKTTPLFTRIESTTAADLQAIATHEKKHRSVAKAGTISEVIALGNVAYAAKHGLSKLLKKK